MLILSYIFMKHLHAEANYHSCLYNKSNTIFKRNTVQNPNTSNPDPQQELQNSTRTRSIGTQCNLYILLNTTYKLTQHTGLHSICRKDFITNAALAILTLYNRHVNLNTSWKSTPQTAARRKEAFNPELSHYAVYFVKLGYNDTSLVHLVHVLNIYILCFLMYDQSNVHFKC